MLQHGAYTLLIDSCYDREKFPTLEEAIEWSWASTTEEIEAVKFVLSRFFHPSDDGTYTQDRILQELLEYHAKADKNKSIAIERETKRKENNTKRADKNTNRTQDVNEPPPNQEPRTNNHKPITIEKHTRKIALDDGFNEFWLVYPKKVAKAAAQKAWVKHKPNLQNVLNTIQWQAASEQWRKGFIPNPATYLNEGRWDDEPNIERMAF